MAKLNKRKKQQLQKQGEPVEVRIKRIEHLIQTGPINEALAQIFSAIKAQPNEPKFHVLLAKSYSKAGDYRQAAKAYCAYLEQKPNDWLMWEKLANAYTLYENFAPSIEAYERCFEEAKKQGKDNGGLLANVALAYMQNSQLDICETMLIEGVELYPNSTEILVNLSAYYHLINEKEKAIHWAEKALEIDLYCVMALVYLAGAKKYKTLDGCREVQSLMSLADDANTKPELRARVLTTLGKVHHDIGDTERAFAYYLKGNNLRFKLYPYNRQNRQRICGVSQHFFPKEVHDLGIQGSDSEAPVFVVGMPRSGSTLIEQILDAHPDAAGIGESPLIGKMMVRVADAAMIKIAGNPAHFKPSPDDYKRMADVLTPQFSKELQEEYLSEARRLLKTETLPRRVIDKALPNFDRLGLIALLFPKAKIIYAARNPLDTCLSMYFHHFSLGLNHSFDLASLTHYYGTHEAMRKFWEEHLPLSMHRTQYENMVADQEEETRKLIEFLGLEWNEACLEFYKSNRFIHTASTEQVRQPIYNASVQRWRAYRKHLSPMIKAFVQAGIIDIQDTI